MDNIDKKKNNNINKFTRDLESKLLNFNKQNIINQESIMLNNDNLIIESDSISFNEPLPSNISKSMITYLNENNNNNYKILKNNIENKTSLFSDIIIYTILFVIINTDYIINLLNNIKNNKFINLFIRTIFFALLIFLYKTYF